MIQEILGPNREFRFWANDAEFYQKAAKTLRSNCVLDTAKLLAAGVKMRPVEEALADSLRHWKTRNKASATLPETMNLLVTGGAGSIGSNLIRHIIDRPEIARLINLDCLTYAGPLDQSGQRVPSSQIRF